MVVLRVLFCLATQLTTVSLMYIAWPPRVLIEINTCIKGRVSLQKSFSNSYLKWLNEWWDYEIYIFKFLFLN